MAFDLLLSPYGGSLCNDGAEGSYAATRGGLVVEEEVVEYEYTGAAELLVE